MRHVANPFTYNGVNINQTSIWQQPAFPTRDFSVDITTPNNPRLFLSHGNPVMFSHKAWKKELTVFKSAIEGSSHRTSVMKIYKLFIHETLI